MKVKLYCIIALLFLNLTSIQVKGSEGDRSEAPQLIGSEEIKSVENTATNNSGFAGDGKKKRTIKQPDSSELKGWADTILRFFNIIIILFIFSTVRRDRRADLAKEADAFWFQGVVLKNNLTFFDTFNRLVERQVEKIIKTVIGYRTSPVSTVVYSGFLKVEHRQFNLYKKYLRKRFFDQFEPLNEEFSLSLNQRMNDFQDEFAVEIYKALPAFDPEQLREVCNTFRKDIFKMLYGEHKKMITKSIWDLPF